MLAVAALLLAGCAPTAAPPPQPSGDELDALIAFELDMQWQYIGLTPDSPRPAVERIRIVSMEESEQVHQECMVAAGYENYRFVTAAVFGGASNLERLAIYTCVSQYPVLPSSYLLFSRAQLAYIYDFYRDVTVPCMVGAGIAVDAAPTRDEFIASPPAPFNQWNPYSAYAGNRVLDDYLVDVKCPYLPPGIVTF